MNACNQLKVSACIDMMFADQPFEQRIRSVRDCGLDAIEFWKWSNKDVPAVVRLKEELGLSFSVMNIDSADEKLSYDLSRGILNTGRKDELIGALQESLPAYRALEAKGLIVLIGETLEGVSEEQQRENVYECLRSVAPVAEECGVTLVVEPLNSYDRKNYFMP